MPLGLLLESAHTYPLQSNTHTSRQYLLCTMYVAMVYAVYVEYIEQYLISAEEVILHTHAYTLYCILVLLYGVRIHTQLWCGSIMSHAC